MSRQPRRPLLSVIAVLAAVALLATGLAIGLALPRGDGANPFGSSASPTTSAAAVVSPGGSLSAPASELPTTAASAGASAEASGLSPAPTATSAPTPTTNATDAPTPTPTKTASPTPTPAPTPVPTIDLTASTSDAGVKLHWGACPAPAAPAHHFRVLRSHDTTVTWPTSADDSAVGGAAVEAAHDYLDAAPPPGAQATYRVLCLADANLALLAASAPVTATVPMASLTIGITRSGNTSVLVWSACPIGTARVAYSPTVTNPSFVPLVRGTLNVNLGNKGVTWTDTTNYAAKTLVSYRVQCVGYWDTTTLLKFAESPLVSMYWQF